MSVSPTEPWDQVTIEMRTLALEALNSFTSNESAPLKAQPDDLASENLETAMESVRVFGLDRMKRERPHLTNFALEDQVLAVLAPSHGHQHRVKSGTRLLRCLG